MGKNKFKENGINISGIFCCPHSPQDNCQCRKPKIGMIKESEKLFNSGLIVMSENVVTNAVEE